MALPEINIDFKERAVSSVEMSERGTLGIVLADKIDLASNQLTLTSIADVPSTLSDKNKKYLEFAFNGYSGATTKVVISYVKKADDTAMTAEEITTACKAFLLTDVTYVTIPEIGENATAVAEYISGTRGKDKKSMLKAVLPHCTADSEAIINFTTDNIVTEDGTYTAAEYAPRIAAVLAGCPLNSSVTFHTLSDVVSVPYLSEDEAGKAIDKGELILYWDGEKVKIARGVNSLTSTDGSKSELWQKIRVVDILDMIRHDIHVTAEDDYIGKFVNDYDHKQMLATAINGYFDTLEKESAISTGSCEIDVDAQRTYLKGKGMDVSKMSEKQILEANTGSHVFLRGTTSPLDVIEEIDYEITLV